MDVVRHEDLKALMTQSNGLCVSLFLPTSRSGSDTGQGSIRLGNLLKDAEGQLIRQGMRAPEAGRLLREARGLVGDLWFWTHQADGLAVFISGGSTQYYRLPIELEELAIVNDRFYLKPLIRLLGSDMRFYLLALSQNSVRLMWGSRFNWGTVALEGVPANLADALKYDEPWRQLQHHAVGPKPHGSGRVAATFHGHGAGKDEPKERIFRYFRMIDDGLAPTLRDETVPLVLAGVDYLIPIYRSATGYDFVADDAVTGNPDRLSDQELHSRAVPLAEPYFRHGHEDAIARFAQFEPDGKATADVEEVVVAAHAGRVESLLLAHGGHRWGRHDLAAGNVELHRNRYQGSEDLLDLAAVNTWLHRGDVFVLDAAQMPGEAQAAAVLRY